MRILESYIKRVLLERGRFSASNISGVELDGWLIGIDCGKLEFMEIFDSFPGNEANRDTHMARFDQNKFIFQKDASIMDHIKSKLGEEKIDSLGGEWDDNLPVFICPIMGDVDSPRAGKVKLAEELDWMVHDIWHGLVDSTAFYDHITNAIEGYDRSYEKKLDSGYWHKIIEEDCFTFLDYYSFTKGVGEADGLPSLAAFSVMRRDITGVDERIFGNKMLSYRSFSKFYKDLYEVGPLVWSNIFNAFKGKVVCLGPL